jgi:hypothetical protein
MLHLTASVLLCLAVISARADAQAVSSGTVAGIVERDTLGHVIAHAEVDLPALNRATITNAEGSFEFADVPAGRHALVVRAIGFQLLVDTIVVAADARVDAEIILTATPVSLPTVQANASKRLPFGLDEMESRRKTHLGGYFVTDSMLRANDEKKLTYFFAQMPGVDQALSTVGAGIFLANPHIQRPGKSDGTFPPGRCYFDVFVDGARYFVGPAGPGNPPPDFAALWANGYSGVEFYPSGATIPTQYNVTGNGCGVILLWTRRTP